MPYAPSVQLLFDGRRRGGHNQTWRNLYNAMFCQSDNFFYILQFQLIEPVSMYLQVSLTIELEQVVSSTTSIKAGPGSLCPEMCLVILALDKDESAEEKCVE